MFSKKLLIFTVLVILLTINFCDCRSRNKNKKRSSYNYHRVNRKSQKQLHYESRETNTPNFVRLLVMRLIYGIAAQMGAEDRVSGIFNGALVPPNADNSDYLDLDFGANDIGGELGDIDLGFWWGGANHCKLFIYKNPDEHQRVYY